MNSHHDNECFTHPVLENGVFWIALILLSMGVITTFYYQDTAALKTVSPHIYKYIPAESEDISGHLLTLYDEETGKPRTVISLDDAGAK